MTLNNKNKLWKLACGSFGLIFSLAAYSDSGPVIISSDAHLTASSTHYADRDVIVDGVVLTLDGEYHFRNLSLTNQARVTHSVGASLHLVIAESLVIEDGTSIDVASRGQIGSGTSRHGGNHGGAGGGRSSDDTFGSFEQPVTFGTAINGSNRGGGMVRITADELRLEGAVIADGRQSTVNYGGASGGSVWLTVGELSGGGRIAANGGPGGSNIAGSGGGGGRIAVYYESSDGFSFDSIQALGGSATSGTHEDGGAGSIYFKNVSDGTSTLRFSGLGLTDAWSLQNGPIPDGTSLEVINTRVVVDNVDANPDGAVETDRHILVDGGFLSFRPVPNEHPPSRWETVILQNEATARHSAIASESTLTHTGIHWSVGQLIIDEGSSIDVTAQGQIGSGASRHGGSHGGAGGQRSSDDTFGSFEQPMTFGTSINGSNRGGGVVRITAEELQLDGAIVADGRQSTVNYGGGSGGSVWLTVGELSGRGRISADGGPGGSSLLGSGGGGGRIAIHYQLNNGFSIDNVQALGGSATGGNYEDGGAGSIYFKNTTDSTSTLRFSGLGMADAWSLQNGPIPDGTTLEVINTRVVVDNVDGDGNPDSAVGVDRHILVDGGFLSFRPVPAELPPSRWKSITLVNEATARHSAIASDSVLTHAGVHWSVAKLSIDDESSIDVTGMGQIGSGASRHGGSYGGPGGERPLDETFGSFEQPSMFGVSMNGSNRGGGIIQITVDELRLDGAIIADGRHSPVNYGGGSGGSVWLTVGKLSGDGQISANGGPGGSSLLGSGGGGGRIAIHYQLNNGFSIDNVQALGGSATGGNYEDGGAGSIYFQDTTSGTSTLRFAGLGVSDTLTLLDAQVPDATTVEVLNTRVVLAGVDGEPNGDSTGADRHIRVDNGYLSFRPALRGLPSHWETVILNNDSVVSHSGVSTDDANSHTGIHWSVRQLIIDEGSSIDVNNRGQIGSGASRHGGSHGGPGGQRPSDEMFGDFEQPTTFGVSINGSNRGGGIIQINAEELRLDGAIIADGRHSPVNYGGGSGGSVWLTVGELSGGGRISANGGSGGASITGSGGGGGRVALYYGINRDFELVNITSLGGLATGSSYQNGGDGTVHIVQHEPMAYIYHTNLPEISNTALTAFTIDFSVPMNAETFLASDVAVQSDSGALVHPASITRVADTRYIVEFDPAIGEGAYRLTVGPNIYAQNGELMDQNQNGVGGEPDDAFVFDFVIDMQAPQTVAVDLPPAPVVTPSTSRSYTLSGTRDEGTSVWINGRQEVSLASGAWSANLSLSEGENTLEIVARDAAGNLSEPVTIIIDVDSIAPSVVSRSPSVAYLATIPENISIQFREQGSGLDLENSNIAVAKDGSAVLGSLSVAGDVLHFHPQIPLSEGHYAFQPTLVDLYGNERVGSTYSFTIDYTPPAPPTVNDYPSVTTINTHTFTGAKEVDTRVYVNGQLASGDWNSTTWSYPGPLAFGENTLVVTQRDRAGNESAPVEILITYNDEAPEPVTISVNPEGGGEDLFVSWVGYDEYKNGNDIAAYHVYVGTEPYSSISLGDATVQVPGGTQSTRLTELERDTQYFISVVAVNTQGLYESDVTPVAVIPVDVQPPENVSNLQVTPGDNDLVLRWQGSANTMGDLAHYQLRYQLEGEPREVSLDPEVVEQAGTASYTLTGLQAASAHQVRITAVDTSGNESEGVSDPGVTLLANPTDTEADGLAGRVNLVWSRTEPHELVDHYRVYVLPDNFTNVSGMQARSSVPGGSQARIQHAIAGLSDGEEVYVAVTAVNTSGGEHPSVTAIPVVPEEDTEGPEVDQVLYSQNGETMDFMLAPVLSHSGQLSVQASDPSGVSRIVLLLNDEPLTTLTQASSGTYRHNLDVFALDDGEQALTIHAYDTLDNRSELTLYFTVNLASPAAPVITQPKEGTTTNREMLALEGTSVPGTRVRILNNGAVVIDEVAVNRRGEFGALLTLEEGENSITAQADYPGRSDWSAPSAARVVVLNTDVPDAPRGITATSRPQGEIQINWLEVTSRDGDNPVRGYNLYRSVAEFTALDQAGVERVNNQLITRTSYTDLVIIDGDYVYAVTAVNEVGSESAPSTNANAKADSSGPKIIELSYEPLGEHDPVTGRIAPGDVRVQAEFDQPLRNEPYFAMVPEGGSPITVDLRKSGTGTRYTGQFRITESTPSGTAYAVMSAYDSVGNRGTEILEGATIQIDTDGPELLELILSPGDPLKVDEFEGLSVNVAASLSDAIKPGTEPRLVPMLNQVPVIGYEEGIPLQADQIPGQDLPRWLGQFDLPVTAGRDQGGQPTVEQLSFEYTGYDDLNNAGQRIHGQRVFQIYQGDLPPLAVPTDLSAQARPQGRVELTWNSVENAHAYVLYRQGPDDNELTELETLSDLQWEDTPSVEGTYLYAISSVRRNNQQEAISAPSDTVSVSTRRTAPKAPDNFELELNGAGIVSRWEAPQEDELGRPQPQDGLTYNLYRLAAAEDEQILSTDGLTPIQTAIPEPIALDSEPSESEHSYFVTAVDAAGNESSPSATGYLNVGLLPVRDLRIEFSEGEQPILSWRHDGQGISHYQVFRESDAVAEPVLLTAEPLSHTDTDTEFVDTRYSAQTSGNTQWRYSVVAVDNFGVESIANQIVLPALNLSLDNTDATLKRGVMNEVVFRVDNVGSEAAQGIRLYVTVHDDGVERVHQSEPFSVAPGAFARVPVVVGGYDGLDSIADLELQLVQIPQPRSEVRLRSGTALSASDDLLSVELQTEDFIRGALGTAQFSLKNTSEVETEILMAENSGQRASSQVRLILEDMDGNVLATQAVQQYSGNVITLPNGNTVARLAPGETFTSAPITMEVPAAAPTQVRLRLAIDRLHYHSGRDTHVTIAGVGTRTTINLTETPYYAQVDEIAPELLYGAEQDVTITGRALSRASDAPQANVPVRLVVDVRGFERSFTVQTDADGEFHYDYRVDSGAGIYRVSAVHPDVQDRPNHGQFQVVGAEVSPRDIRVNIPRNYTQEIPIRVNAGHDSTLTNLRLTPVSADGVSIPQLPMGVTVELGTLNQLQPRGTGYLPLRFTGDNSANRTGTVRYRVEADHFTDDNALAEITLDYTLSEARPAVVAKPAFIDTGLGLEDSITETVNLSNNGLDVLRSGQIELVDAHGAPAPSWINVLGSSSLGDLAVGDSRALQIAINPDDQTTEGNHEFALRVLGENVQTHTVPVFVAVTQSGIGNAFFHISDIYTATLDENNQPIPGLQGARIELQNEQVLTETYSLTTNALGEATFEGIPAGRYSYRASAFDHGSKSGRVWIRPGVTTSESVFLMNSLITIEWSVREITIEDRYEIKLEATFETNVPVAVVMFHPLSVQLPVMEQGDVFQGELTLTNHGLIRATNVRQTLPSSNDLVSFEFLRAVPEALEAGEVFTLPYRVRALRDFNPEADAMATGGGCGSFNTQTRVNYQSECVNGEVVPSSTSVSWNSNWGRCTPPSRNPIRRERSDVEYAQPYSNGGIRMINRGGLGSMTEEPLWCMFVTECEDGNCDNASAK